MATPPAASLASPAAAGAAPPVTPAAPKHRAEVLVTGDQLEIRASNSSLNQILRQIARQTNMSISGGVIEQRVYGTYGPGPASDVLSELLQDTGTNMILRMTPSGRLGELILSPRMAGPSPPAPNTYQDEPEEAQAPAAPQPAPAPVAQTPAQPAAPAPQVPALPFSQPTAQPAATDPFATPQTPDPGGIVGAPTVAPATEPGTTPGPATQSTGTSDPNANSANPASPNGVKTPQQIYLELQKLLQQQQKPAAPQ